MILQGKANVLVLTILLCGVALAQEPASVAFKTSTLEPAATSTTGFPETPQQHRFWDWENRALFSTVAVSSAADFVVTRNNLASGGKELNPITRLFCGSTPALVANFAGETAGVVGLSYFFHRTGHHKLERATPAVNIAFSAFAVAYSRTHR
jgi:hypothetical protein